MIFIQKKQQQYCGVMFDGHFFFNKPVYSNYTQLVEPYSAVFYFSHAVTDADCTFPLHPHEGFEIITFILDGQVQHFDTETKTWTNLNKGDFQIIVAGKGVQHSERLMKGSRTFQIWFDPNFRQALNNTATYSDYHAIDFPEINVDGVPTVQLIGGNSKAVYTTNGLNVKRVKLSENSTHSFQLSTDKSYTFYVLDGYLDFNSNNLIKDDSIRIIGESEFKVNSVTDSELFILELPKETDYKPIWERM